jgi:exonuclease I
VLRAERPDEDAPWIGGLRSLIDELSLEAAAVLQRELDTGDVLVLLAASDTLAGQALARLGVEIDEVARELDEIRAEPVPSRDPLVARIVRERRRKEELVDQMLFESAADARDRERQLVRELRETETSISELLPALRHRLGLPEHE